MKLAIDTTGLVNYVKKLNKAQKNVTPTMSNAINEVGDSLVGLLARDVAKDTGLAVEQVRGQMRVTRAKKDDLTYQIELNKQLLEGDPSALEGRRESKDFGKRKPDTLVIIVSAQDELVCPDCEELAAAGPMPIETAREHIPKHPHCRCIIMPYTPKGRRLPVTMTTMTGTDPAKRSGRRQDREMTLRQMARQILDKTATKIKIELE